MKKTYLEPQFFKYDSLKDITLQTEMEDMSPACFNQASESGGCSGSCTTYQNPENPNWTGYKANPCP